MNRPLRFHWRLPQAGERSGEIKLAAANAQRAGLPEIEAQVDFCRRAEQSGIDSLLTAFGYYMPDPMLLAAALGRETEKIKFIVAYRPGLLSPTLFVQQVNTLSALINGRVSLNIVAGHSQKEQAYYGDFLDHDERYRLAEEFLTICHALWTRAGAVNFSGQYLRVEQGQLNTPFVSPDRMCPEIYLGGGSPLAQALAIKHASCWLLLADAPERLRPRIESALEQGIEVGLRASLIVRPTRQEAVEAAYAMIQTADTKWVDTVFVQGSDSMSMKAMFAHAKQADAAWLTPSLWNGAVPTHGVSAIALVGAPPDIATAIMEYREIGFSQFIFSGWPNIDAVTCFGTEVLPLIRQKESR